MGFFRDLEDDLKGGLKKAEDFITGKSAERAAEEAAQTQVEFAERAKGLLDPFAQVGQQAIGQAGVLLDPQAQFDFLQSNPLFNLALENANRQTQQLAAARGRLSAGDTLQQLSNNVLLSAQPLLAQQQQNVGNLLNFGQNVAANQGNLLTGQGAALAGGIVGGQNARQQGFQNVLDIGTRIAGGLF